MEIVKKSMESKRAVFLDNLRSLMVVIVLIFHSVIGYSSAAKYWPFHEGGSNAVIDIFLYLCDAFMMAMLFFIAGYFALPSLKKRGTAKFITNKLQRLGLPWLIIVVILLPILDYIYYVRTIAGATGFPSFWLQSMGKIAGFYTGWMDMSSYHNMTQLFFQRYMWYLSLLVLFFVLFALIYKIKSHFAKKAEPVQTMAEKSIFAPVLIVSAVMIVLFSVVMFNYPSFTDYGWFSLANIFQFQFGEMIIYIACFTLGVMAFSRGWLNGKSHFKRWWVYIIFCVCLFAVNAVIYSKLVTETPTLGTKIAYCVFYPLWTLSFILMFLSIGYRFWNKPTKLNVSVSQNSFRMYLIHYIVPNTLPLLLLGLNIPTLIKAIIVAIVTIGFSYAVSRWIMGSISNAMRKYKRKDFTAK